jgi:hypothetical protein
MHFYDEEIDKFWLCGLSPYVALRHTKSDLGPWDKVSDESWTSNDFLGMRVCAKESVDLW